MRRLLVLLLCLTLPAFGGGALYFDGSSYYTCGGYKLEFDAADPGYRQLGVMAWVTPDFASSSGTTRGIIGNRDISICPRRGFNLAFSAALGGSFTLQSEYSNCCAFLCPGTPPVPVFVRTAATFSAGDLLGIAGVVKHDIQQITVYNATTGVYSSGTEARGWDPLSAVDAQQSGTDLEIGRGGPASGNNPWLGKIHLLVLQVGEAKNTNNKQLDAISKFRFLPQFTGTTGLNGGSGTQILDGVWLFEDDEGSLATLRNDSFNAGTEGVDVCDVVGNPVPVETEMMR